MHLHFETRHYSDDGSISGQFDCCHKCEIKRFGCKISDKGLGYLHYCIGIEFNQSKNLNYVVMSQKKYTTDILKKFNMMGV